ncbi:MAG: hypothetical protein AB7O29_10520 [Acidimicrobiia bacterium]
MPTPARPPLRPRRRLHRPLPHWVAVAGAALLPALVVGRLTAEAGAERDRWGPGRATLDVVHDVAAGDTVRAGDVERRSLPDVARPAQAVDRLPNGAVAAADLVAGEVLVSSRLAPAGSSALAARLPPGTRGIAVPNEAGPPLEDGDRVDVLVTLDPATARPTTTVTRSALVLDVGDDAVTVAVALDDAERVAFAAAAGLVTLALSGPRSR